MQKIKAAFFDRDGTLIKDVSYLNRISDIDLLPKAISLAQMLQRKNFTLFVITNQSGIARGFFDEQFVLQSHDHLQSMLNNHGISIKKFYHCPHHPTQAIIEQYKQDCACRKPKPGMLLNAAQEHNIDLSASLMFGDKGLDLEAGRAAGCNAFDIVSLLEKSEEEWERTLFQP